MKNSITASPFMFPHHFLLLPGVDGLIQIDGHEQKVLKMQLANLCLSGDTIKHWKLPPASSHTTATLEPEEECYESDFEDAEDEGSSTTPEGSTPAVQQLLGATPKGSSVHWGSGVEAPAPDHTDGLREPSGGATLRQGISAAGVGGGACWPNLDEVGLSVGLPKAGFGFASGVGPSDAVSPVKSWIPPRASSRDLESLSAGMASPDAVGRLTALAGHGVEELLVKPPSFTFSPPPPQTKSRHRSAMVDHTQSCSATGKIRLHEALTNRAIFLKRELEDQLGGKKLKEACDALRAALHVCLSQRGAGDGDVEWSDGGLREALSGILSPVHLELAPLVDELVLLQERFYA